MQPPIRPGTPGYPGQNGQNGQNANSGSQPPMPANNANSGPQPPMPANPSDFYDDTGYAPELRAERSENLYRRDERFWQRVPDQEQTMHGRPRQDTYFSHQERFEATRPSGRHKAAVPRGRRGSRTIACVLGVVLVLAVVVALLASPLFSVREIRVQGNSRFSSEEIVRMSGIKVGMNRFRIQADDVTRRVETNRYLVCELVHMPEWGVVEIRVRERVCVAAIEYNGLLFYVDNRGMVLEENVNTSAPLTDKIRVKGLSVRRCDIGRIVSLNNDEQLSVFNEIMVELKVMSALDRIAELDMSSMESIFLVTRDDYSVRLGNGSDIHQKLRSMLLTLEALYRDGRGPGAIDVSAPVNPTYIPDEDSLTAAPAVE